MKMCMLQDSATQPAEPKKLGFGEVMKVAN